MTEPAYPTEHYETTWRGIAIRIAFAPVSFGGSENYRVSHFDIETDAREPLPITETGYRSHFLPPDEVEDAGGPVAYVVAWLDHAAQSPDWKRREDEMRQGSLF